MVRKVSALWWVGVLLWPLCATAQDVQNLTARLQQAVMEASLREYRSLLREGSATGREYNSLPYTQYPEVDQWVAGAPGRFRDYNLMARTGYERIAQVGIAIDLQDTARGVFVDTYDFTAAIEGVHDPGHLHQVWTRHEVLLRRFPERLYLLRAMPPGTQGEAACREQVRAYLTDEEDQADQLFQQAATVFRVCLVP